MAIAPSDPARDDRAGHPHPHLHIEPCFGEADLDVVLELLAGAMASRHDVELPFEWPLPKLYSGRLPAFTAV